jgi:hypothetical protein
MNQRVGATTNGEQNEMGCCPDWPERTKKPFSWRQQLADLDERLPDQNLGSLSKRHLQHRAAGRTQHVAYVPVGSVSASSR